MAAGLQLKNYLTSKNLEIRMQYHQAWLSFDPSVRQHIKTMVSSKWDNRLLDLCVCGGSLSV